MIPEASIHLAEREGLVDWIQISCLDREDSLGEDNAAVLQILENVTAALVRRDSKLPSEWHGQTKPWHIQLLACCKRLALRSGKCDSLSAS